MSMTSAAEMRSQAVSPLSIFMARTLCGALAADSGARAEGRWRNGAHRRHRPSLRRNRLVDELAAGTDREERVGGGRAELADHTRGAVLSGAEERAAVAGEQLAQRRQLRLARRAEVDLRALRETRAQARGVDPTGRIHADEDDAARHAGADPTARIAQDDRGARGHVLE